MDLGTIYNLLHQAKTFQDFMMFNNEIHKIEEISDLTNNRKDSKISSVHSGKNKILDFINSKTKQ